MRFFSLRKAPSGKWLLCFTISAFALLAAYWPQGLMALRYDRMPILSGEVWRMLSAHLVHMNTAHLMLNLLALFLLCELLWRDMPVWQGAGLLMAGAFGVSVLLFVFHPELAWYAGLSGALHCLWAGCALRAFLKDIADSKSAAPWRGGSESNTASRMVSVAALMLLFIKLWAECYFGPSERTAQAIGGEVIAVAHAYGALVGIACVLGYACMCRNTLFSKPAARVRFRLK